MPRIFFWFGQISDPDVEQHDRAQPRADADDELVVVERLGARAERERADEVSGAQQIPGAGQPGGDRGPAEPEQRARRDVLA